MLLFQTWLRKRWLERALRGYPLYDPPHKVEERLLSKENATENFEYFICVRMGRLAHFQGWLRQHFSVAITLDEKGMRALNRWGNKYAGLLLVLGPNDFPDDSYFTYSPPWIDQHAGCNVLFDMGIALGEAIVANYPKLRWEVDPISEVLPRTAMMLKREPGSGFQRPELTGFEDPTASISPFEDVHGFATQMLRHGPSRFKLLPHELRSYVRDQLLNSFSGALISAANTHPQSLRKQMPPDEYAKFIDRENVGGGEIDE